jgi:hypothetical protein
VQLPCVRKVAVHKKNMFLTWKNHSE